VSDFPCLARDELAELREMRSPSRKSREPRSDLGRDEPMVVQSARGGLRGASQARVRRGVGKGARYTADSCSEELATSRSGGAGVRHSDAAVDARDRIEERGADSSASAACVRARHRAMAALVLGDVAAARPRDRRPTARRRRSREPACSAQKRGGARPNRPAPRASRQNERRLRGRGSTTRFSRRNVAASSTRPSSRSSSA